jgi:hypothetical protein
VYSLFSLCFTFSSGFPQTAAKIGSQLGQNYWDVTTRQGATIKTAIDYLMKLNPGSEDISELCPHIAAALAAYGDPAGQYLNFLKRCDPDYAGRPYWFYNQPSALRMRSAIPSSSASAAVAKKAPRSGAAFGCPPVFALTPEVELDYGVFVTCDDLKRFYVGPGQDAIEGSPLS